jgi:hypothetical protein
MVKLHIILPARKEVAVAAPPGEGQWFQIEKIFFVISKPVT